MLKAAMLSLLLLGAPELTEAQKKLKLAYASLYEWKEDGVKNVTLDFTYIYTLNPPGDGAAPTRYDGRGQVVVVGIETIRRHLEGGSTAARDAVKKELDWIVERYARPSFDERFKETPLKGPEKTLDGSERIRAGKLAYLLRKDRIVAVERDFGTQRRPNVVRVEYTLADVGDGYGVIGEKYSFTRANRKYMTTRKLSPLTDAEVPMPKAYEFNADTDRGKVTIQIKFDKPRRDLKTPVVIEESARDILRTAWENRYTLPESVRIESKFQRKLDRELDKSGWTELVRGQLQVWGLGEIDIELDDKILQRDKGRRRRVRAMCLGFIQEMFERMRERPFETEFENCGFEMSEGPGGETAVRILGHDALLSVVITDARVTGHMDNLIDRDWWTYRVKRTKDDRVLIQQMWRTFEGRKFTLKFSYARIKGVFIPKKFQSMVTPENAGFPVFGVLEFSLKRPKVEVPKD